MVSDQDLWGSHMTKPCDCKALYSGSIPLAASIKLSLVTSGAQGLFRLLA